MKTYLYTITTSDADGKEWVNQGIVTGDPHDAFRAAMEQNFAALTGGKAVFGEPGVGCHGPYTVQKILLERMYG